MIQILKQMECVLSGAEIGVAGGDNANDILQGLNIEKLILVDSYPVYNIETTEQGQNAKMISTTTMFNKDKRVTFITKDSVEAAQEVEDASLDFVYIDANHSLLSVKADIEAWLPKVKKGGLIGGHDFDSREDNYGVFRAVTEWTVPNDLTLSSRQSDWWVTI